MDEKKFSHIDETGNPRMVDIGSKPETKRIATARGRIKMSPSTCQTIIEGSGKKGNVLTTAQIAGIMAAKKTEQLIPLCHPILLTDVEVEFSAQADAGVIEIEASAKCTGRTGVEMEALTAVSVAALTIYDMVKAVDRAMKIEEIRLIRKSGGKSGTFAMDEDNSSEEG